jgi:haloalkane dehalogenase
METTRTPDERFADLPGYPFAPHYVEIDDADGGVLRVHHVDEGPSDGPVVLLLHGEPSWSYLYRTMIPPLAAAGCRVIAPDLVGFGRSDKPTRMEDYTYERHVAWLTSHVIDALDLRDVTLFCQDWGGLLGLRLVAAHPDRFAAVIAANTFLPIGKTKLSDAFFAWREFSQSVEDFPVGRIIDGGCVTTLPAEVIAAYDAPYASEEAKAGARIFPTLVPATPDAPSAAENEVAMAALSLFDRPFVTAFGDSDPVTAGTEAWFQRHVAGAEGQPHVIIEGGGHFIQEDAGPELARIVLAVVASQEES